MNLETPYAEAIIDMLEEAQDIGISYAFWEKGIMDWPLNRSSFSFFDTYGAAHQHWLRQTMSDDTPVWEEQPAYYFKRIDDLLEEIKIANGLIKEQDMNKNNLENLTEEMKMLGLGEKEITQMKEKMIQNLPSFEVLTKIPGSKGVIDTVLFFKQSNQSDNYYLNKFNVTLNKAQQLEEGQQYAVLTQRPEGENVQPLMRRFDSPYEAVAFFKEVAEKSELVVGHMAVNKKGKEELVRDQLLAERENGKTIYVTKEFNKTFNEPVQDQTCYVEKGRGFTVIQAANMIEGRSVYRDDLLNIGGQPYKAWMKLDMDGARDRHGNYMMNQYKDPAYGFNISEVLDNYRIKVVADPEKKEAIIAELKLGNRPLVTTTLDDKEVKLHLEAVPRYSQVNFYQENGKPEKREQFETAAYKEQKIAEAMAKSKNQDKAAAKQEGQGMAV
ncbi:hypothetical protein ACFQZX_00280 [Mucilaginibacter litoreus]|uniref:DUF3945 domain-containing protein n=1 Tax=Mucilaginibacter litoreus TaxID=1048221 RepID=A0ABW3AME1_9SPHI